MHPRENTSLADGSFLELPLRPCRQQILMKGDEGQRRVKIEKELENASEGWSEG